MVAAMMLVAALAAAANTPKAEVRNVRIASPKIVVSRAHAGSDAIVTGQIRVDMSFARPTARKPVLKLACLCEAGGALSVHTIFLDRPRTTEGMRRSEIMAAFKRAGVEIPFAERAAAYADPATFTPHLAEVAKKTFTAAVYGTADVDRGFFRLGRSETLPRVLLYRIEIWQNGVRVATYESSRAGLGPYDIPADWHVWKKHPEKFTYADIR